jgi:hypothetical protein
VPATVNPSTVRLRRNLEPVGWGRLSAVTCCPLWRNTAFERAVGDLGTAAIQLDLGQLDTAEQFAASAMHTYGENHRLGRIWAELLLAEIHIRAGEPHGLTLAHHAIKAMNTLQSITARQQRLIPLATALEARPNNDTQQLARMARKIVATRI